MRVTRVKHGRRFRQAGNVLIEFALMSSLLMLLTLGVVDFGRLFYFGNSAYSGAQAGAAYASLSPTHAADVQGIQDAVLRDLPNFQGVTSNVVKTCRCSSNTTTVDCATVCNQGALQTWITVNVTIPFATITRIPWLSPSINVRGAQVVPIQ